MAEKSSFFDSINADRVYYAADWASHMAEYFTNGIFNNGLRVVANNDMSISVQLGAANINGYKYKLDTNPKIIEVANADGILNRIDNIVIRLDIPNRQVTAEIVPGTFAENAIAPGLIRGTSVYEIRIAKINIPAGTTAITTDLIEDTRFDNNDCGNVICAVQTPNFTDILSQYEALWETLINKETEDFEAWFNEKTENFNNWFEKIKNKLSGDIASKLQLELDNLQVVIKAISSKNAGSHNAIYRGENITDLFYNGTLSQQIAAETFDDIFIGDYIVGQISGRKYLVADINYRLHTGDTECATPHILMIPEKVMGTSWDRMNTSNTTVGGYTGSLLYTSGLEEVKQEIKNDFGLSHILTHRNYLSNEVTDGRESDGGWYDSDIELMNETMVHGCNIYKNYKIDNLRTESYGIDTSQLSLFKHRHDLIIGFDSEGYRQPYWLRDVVSSTSFAGIYDNGIAKCFGASSGRYTRPAFLIY